MGVVWLILSGLADNMRPEDVGLSKDIPFFKAKRAAQGIPKVTCATVYKCEEFSVRPIVSGSFINLGTNWGKSDFSLYMDAHP